MRGTASALRAWCSRRRAALLLGLPLLLLLWVAPVRLGVVLGESMSPSFHTGQVFLMSRIGAMSEARPGEVVVVKVDGELYLKRVLATAGETVWGLDSAEIEGAPDVIVSPMEVGSMRDLARRQAGVGRVVDVTVPPGHVFVVGDAENNSYDSRNFGPVPVEAIRGKVVVSRLLRLWGPEGGGQSVVMAGEKGHSISP